MYAIRSYYVLLVSAYFQAQPFAVVGGKVEFARPRRGVPGRQQVVFELEDVGGVARAHQRFGAWRRLVAGVQRPAAGGVGLAAAAGTSVVVV